VTHGVIGDVSNDPEVANTVDGTGTVERLVNGVASDVRHCDRPNKMEVDWVPSELEGLTNVEELNVLNTGDDCLAAVSMHDHVSTVLVNKRRLRVALY
jgi:hypothetical protein